MTRLCPFAITHYLFNLAQKSTGLLPCTSTKNRTLSYSFGDCLAALALDVFFSFAVYKGVEPFSSHRQWEIIAVIPINQFFSRCSRVCARLSQNFARIVMEPWPLTTPCAGTLTKTPQHTNASAKAYPYVDLPFYFSEIFYFTLRTRKGSNLLPSD